VSAVAVDPSAEYTLRIADDCFIISHRLAQWSSRAPTLEEDVALTNLALDLLGQARSLYGRVAELDGSGRGEDGYAFLRDEREFVNCLLVEQENGDFAVTIARQLLFSAYQVPLWKALTASSDGQLAAVAAKAVKECVYHLDHASQWTRRLGDGTHESHRRMQAALESLWPYTNELFETDAATQAALERKIGAEPAALRTAWAAHVDEVLETATLDRPSSSWQQSGGRRGLHTESFGYLLAEMQHLHRSHPGARW
jgi:ring-1,2-phenylacetyl-CoA epoxidase subunit PaaC